MPEPAPIPRGLIALMALACGLAVANLYYAQPLAGPIGHALGLGRAATGLVVTLTQIGYGLGLIFLVPLGDLVENRRLIVATAAAGGVATAIAAIAPSAGLFLAASLLVGFCSVSAQMLVPVAAHLASERERGRVVGEVMSGLLAGILLARPAASLIDDYFGWRVVFAMATGVMLMLALTLWRLLPARRPEANHSYVSLLGSMGRLLLDTPVLQRRAAYQTCMFAAFSLFWTAVPLLLASPAYSFSQTRIAVFALAGATGALIAPVAGRLADRGLTRPASGVAFLAAALCFVVGWFGRKGGDATGVGLLVAAALLLDLGVQMSQILGQRAIYTLGAAERSRLNALYVALFFIGGAAGSGLGAALYAWGGWGAACGLGLAFCLTALVIYATEFVGGARPADQVSRNLV